MSGPKDVSGIELEDSFCSPDNPQTVTFDDVKNANMAISKHIEFTPCLKSKLSEQLGMTVYLKKEFLQYTGSFKERGARNSLFMLNDDQKKKGVVAASLGNHSQGLSYHSQLLNIPCTVVMPLSAPYNKIQKCRNFGANVIIHGKNIDDARKHAMLYSKKHEMIYINGYDHPHVIAGQGTIGIEVLEQVEDVDAIIIPVGGGGLIAGIATAAKALKPNIQIIGVESEKCTGMANAIRNGRPTYTPSFPTIADGLAVPTVGYNSFATALPLVDKMIAVKEETIMLAMLHLVELEKCVIEGSAGAGLAAILEGQLNELKNKNVVVILCGGNIDTSVFGRCLERGLIVEGRLLGFSVIVGDQPGNLSDLCTLASTFGVSIIDVIQERRFWPADIYNIELKVICETRDWDHAEQFRKILTQKYPRVSFNYSTINEPC